MQQPKQSLPDEESKVISICEYSYTKKEIMTLQQQNFWLARINSNLLEKQTEHIDRLKLLQHDLKCKKGLLVAKELQLKENGETSQKVDKEVIARQNLKEESGGHGDIDKTPGFKPSPSAFVVNRSHYARNYQCSSLPTTVGDFADDATCQNINKGFVADLNLVHKPPARKDPSFQSSLAASTELERERIAFELEYEDLLLQFETQKTISDIQIDSLTRKLSELGLYVENSRGDYFVHRNANRRLNQSEASFVAAQLPEKINVLEIEKSSSQQKRDSIVEVVTAEQSSADENFEQGGRDRDTLESESESESEHFDQDDSEGVDFGLDEAVDETGQNHLAIAKGQRKEKRNLGCSCTRKSTCKTVKCECRARKRDCISSCTCKFLKCSNRKKLLHSAA